MKKRFLSLFCAFALVAGLLPVTALAAEGAPSQLYVGNQQVINGSDNATYWTTDTDGNLTQSAADQSWNVKYDPATVTLTLRGATIQGGTNTGPAPFGSGIYALCSEGQSVALTIELIGTNTITGNYGIYVDAQQGGTVGTNASLLIRNSSDNGILEVSGSFHGIYVKSGTGNASLTIKDASVVASSSSSYDGYAGVCVQSGSDATSSPQLSLAVDGGSLTTSGGESSDGIWFYVGSSQASNATTSLTVSKNAIVAARNGGIKASDSSMSDLSDQIKVSSGDGTNGGIVFDGSTGTVYGTVELQNDLTIGAGETLTIPDGASLDTNGKLTVDGGTLNGTPSGDVTYKVTKVELSQSALTLDVGDEETLTAAITPDNATDKSVTWESSDTSIATVDTSGKVTAVGTGSATITATAADGSGEKATCSVTVKEAATVPVESVSLDKTSLELTEGDTGTLIATVEPNNATNKNVTWSTSNASIATVDANGLVTAVSAGTATITVTTEDGSFTAKCTVTVREDVPDRPVSIPDTHEIELIAGEGGEAKTNFTNAGAGTKITVTATPNDGYELAYITVDGERIDGTTFKMPDHDVTVRVYFSGGALPFADVTEGAWYYDAVSYVCANGLMDGVSASEFAPEANMTRAMVWTILARIDGETITGTSWAEAARAWAMESGVSDGTDPNGLVTREQLAAMLYRYAGEPAVSGSLSAYTDADSVSEWATDAMLWATQNGIITGTTATTLAPQSTATRAQCAAMLMRFAER